MGKISTLMHKWLDGAYCVGIMENSASDIITNKKVPEIHWVKADTDDTWMADPFIIDSTKDKITLLVEEYVVAENKGRLSKIVVDRKTYKVIEKETILTLPTHLSFPLPVEIGGKTYICPESNGSGNISFYEFDGDKCRDEIIIKSRKSVDTQIVRNGGGYFLFTVPVQGKGMEDTKTVEIYRADTPTGPYELIQTWEKDRCEGRGAGPIFRLKDGRTIRPAQNCEGGYGKGVIFFDLKYENGKFTETEIFRIDANGANPNGLCFHTFSPWKEELVAVDGFDYKSRCLARIAPVMYKCKSLINKILR